MRSSKLQNNVKIIYHVYKENREVTSFTKYYLDWGYSSGLLTIFHVGCEISAPKNSPYVAKPSFNHKSSHQAGETRLPNHWYTHKQLLLYDPRHDKTNKMTVLAQRRLRSAWASAQFDQSLRCPPEESLGPNLHIKRTKKALARLGGCQGWSESSLGAHAILLVLSWGGSYFNKMQQDHSKTHTTVHYK